jgi:hypothetical protein
MVDAEAESSIVKYRNRREMLTRELWRLGGGSGVAETWVSKDEGG